MKKLFKSLKNYLYGTIIGGVNAFFGAGGGLICVPVLMSAGFSRKDAHANAIAVILPITVLSAANYLISGHLSISDSLIFLPGGILGSILGTKLMKTISPSAIKKIFGVFMIWAGWRLVFK